MDFRHAIAMAFALAGCATHTGVIDAGAGEFVIMNEAGTGFSGIAGLKEATLRQAGEHCAASGRTFESVSETETKPPFILGNYPRYELRFRCVAR